MHLGVEGLDTSVKPFREAGDVGDLFHCDIVLFQKFVGSTGGDDLHAHRRKVFGEIHNTGLIGNADNCSLNLYQFKASKGRSVLRTCFPIMFNL